MLEAFPDAEMGEDDYGQLIIHTGLTHDRHAQHREK